MERILAIGNAKHAEGSLWIPVGIYTEPAECAGMAIRGEARHPLPLCHPPAFLSVIPAEAGIRFHFKINISSYFFRKSTAKSASE